MSTAPHPYASAIKAIADRTPVHPSAPSLKSDLDAVSRRAAALDAVNRSRSPLDTPAAHSLKVAKAARAFDKEVTAALNRAFPAVGEARAAIGKRIAEKANLKPNPKYEMLVCQAFRDLEGPARMEQISRWIEDGNGPELATILQAPPIVSGLSAEQIKAFETGFVAKHAADEMEELERLDEALEAFSAASKASSRFVKELVDPGSIAGIERADAEAQAAAKDFAQSLQ